MTTHVVVWPAQVRHVMAGLAAPVAMAAAAGTPAVWCAAGAAEAAAIGRPRLRTAAAMSVRIVRRKGIVLLLMLIRSPRPSSWSLSGPSSTDVARLARVSTREMGVEQEPIDVVDGGCREVGGRAAVDVAAVRPDLQPSCRGASVRRAAWRGRSG